MKDKNLKRKKASAQKGPKTGKRVFSIHSDPFFDTESKRGRKLDNDEDIESSEDEDFDDERSGGEDKAAEEEEEEETAAEKRKKVAEAYLEKIRATAKREMEEEEEREGSEGEEREGERDSLVAQILLQEQMEESGRVRRLIASRYNY